MSKHGKTVEVSLAELSAEARAAALRKHGFLKDSYTMDSKQAATVLSPQALTDRVYRVRKGHGPR